MNFTKIFISLKVQETESLNFVNPNIETKFQPFRLRNDKDIHCPKNNVLPCPENDIPDYTLFKIYVYIPCTSCKVDIVWKK